MRDVSLLALSAMLFLPATVVAMQPEKAQSSKPDTVWNAALRFRLETVDQDGFNQDALAATTRLRLGIRHRLATSLIGFVEGEATWAMNDQFDSGANGRSRYPSVIDPTAVEFNQMALIWQTERTEATLGRQRIQFDNQRFIGNSGWRQNEQTFDAALLAFNPTPRWAFHYGYSDCVHRVATDRARSPRARESNLDAHLLHVTAITAMGPVSAYFYASDDQDVAAASTVTEGLRFCPSHALADWHWIGVLEYARQRGYASNPRSFSHDYLSIEAGVKREQLEAKLGLEVLEGNGRTALQTPLATLHAFNGWADQFLITPVNGLEDRYASITGELPWRGLAPLKWTLVAHDFYPNRPGARYGQEWDASLATSLGKGWTALLKVADYQADAFGRDTRKLWLQVEWAR